MQLIVGNKNYSTWPLRAWVLLKELNIPFVEHIAPKDDLTPGDVLRERWIHVTPTRKFPLLIDDTDSTNEPVIVWDTLSIVEYLYESYPSIWPQDKRARAYARSAAAEMHSGFSALRNTCNNIVGLRIKLHATDADFDADINRLITLIKQGLDTFGGPFIAGSTFTAADAMYCPVAFRLQTYGITLPDTAVHAYFDRLRVLVSMKEWEESALNEPYRIQLFEDNARQVGTILEDLRRA